ncbi:hypothetical protein KFL_001320190 [Klebsormidium nitens]|uniref:Uncharacterized protein n=1 Tax=Klebsormidium nitens TaxID=105231 RepID=A0A1Y1I1F4_KLENI|nr:hypothetical protein KFL_001320190 [Klebsormidium nitens]|eukprot:GAQ83011.1 hypothetical protein KFL_001320190 [Klebsormidium nitens]
MVNGRRSKWKVLAVLSGPPPADQLEVGPSPASSNPAGSSFSPADFIRSFPGLQELQGGEAEVQFIERPTLQMLQNIVQAMQPNLVFFSHRDSPWGTEPIVTLSNEASVTGLLMLGDAQPPSSENLAEIFSVHFPDLVLANVVLTPKHAELMRSKGVQHVIYWPTHSAPPAAAQFFTALFSCLRNPSVSPHDAFRLAESAHRIHCSTPLPRPSISGIPPPRSVSCSLELQQRIPPNGTLSASVLFKLHQELRLLLFGAPAVLEPPKTQALGEGLRVLLAAEVRGLRLTQHAVGGAPNQEVAAIGARNGATFARCELCTGSGARLAVTAVGRAEAFEDREVLEYHLKRHLFDQSALQTLPKAPSLLPARRTTTIASGGPTCEVFITLPDWGKDLLIQLAADVSYRPLAALGLAGVGGFAVAAFTAADGERLSGLGLEIRAGSPAGAELANGGVNDGLVVPPGHGGVANGGADGGLAGTPGSGKIELDLVDGGGVEKRLGAMLDAKSAKRIREEELRANLRAWKRAAAASLEREAPVARPVLQRFRQRESMAPVTPDQVAPIIGGSGAAGGVMSVSPPFDHQRDTNGGAPTLLHERPPLEQNGPSTSDDQPILNLMRSPH